MRKTPILFILSLCLFSTSVQAVPLAQVQVGLWSKATYRPSLMVAGALGKAEAAYGRAPDGSILDIGALREVNGQAEVLVPSGWVPYQEREHRNAANVYARVGPGWSFGNNSIHNSARGWFQTVCGRRPDSLESTDMQYSGTLFETLKRAAIDGVTEEARKQICSGSVSGPVVIPPPPPPPPPVDPKDPVVCPPVLPCPSCPSQSMVICPVLSRLAKEFSCQGF